MRIFPVLLDSRPEMLADSPVPTSLLLFPVSDEPLAAKIQASLSSMSPTTIVVPSFHADDEYRAAMTEACPAVESILTPRELNDRLREYEPSDVLLIIDPRCFPAVGFSTEGFIEGSLLDSRCVRHVAATDTMIGAAEECLEIAAGGEVRRIQRYYGSVTWPLTSGPWCTFLPVACTVMTADLPLGSLSELRRDLSAQTIPSRDLLIAGGAFDLTDERGLLGVCERFVLDSVGETRSPIVHERASVHPTARIAGPVVVHEGATVEEGALVLGPSVVGPGARVGRGSVVAQCVVGPGASVAAGASVRHRAIIGTLVEKPANGDGSPREKSRAFSGTGPAEVPHLIEVRARERSGSIYPAVKRSGDALLAALGLLVTWPLLVVIAILIKLESRGSVLYGDSREGSGESVFKCWKFRTMVQDAHVRQRRLASENFADGPQFKLDHDPRVTRLGRWLRLTNLDELPQLINVLLGQMSFVGPRPSPFRENQMCIPWRRARLSVRPGITGLWQVCRHERASGDFHQWIYYDLLYVRHVSLWLDIKIFVATLATLGGRTSLPLNWILSSALVRRA